MSEAERPQGEFDLIAQLVERLPPPGPEVRVGSGDDAAVTEPTEAATVTTVDSIVEGVHFRLTEFPLAAVGRKGLAAALSDLAAMGAEPGEAYIALGVPEHVSEDGLLELADGLAEVAGRDRVAVVGGDVTRSPALSLAVTCVGREPALGRLIRRDGACPGDFLAVTGELGGAAAALLVLGAGGDSGTGWGSAFGLDAKTSEALIARQLDPRPRLGAGIALAASGASAMIDVSDGLGADAGHLARASAARLQIDTGRIPIAGGVEAVAGGAGGGLDLALGGGEDFELLVTVPPERFEAAEAAVRDAGERLTRIGEVSAGDGVAVDQSGRRLDQEGFDHMRGSRSGSG